MLTGIIFGIIIFVLFFAGSYSVYKFYSLNIVFKKAKYYIDLFSDDKVPLRQKKNIINGNDQSDIVNEDNYGFKYVLRMVSNLNYSLFGDFFDAIFSEKKKKTDKEKLYEKYLDKLKYSDCIKSICLDNQNCCDYICCEEKDDCVLPNCETGCQDKGNYMNIINNINFDTNNIHFKLLKNKLTLKWFPKLYLILLAAGIILMLLKLTVNFTFSTIIAKTINSDNDVTPYGQNTYKPSTNFYTKVFEMFLLFLLNVFIALLPTLFIYGFNMISKLYCNIKGIWLMIITLLVLIPVLVYFYYNLFSDGFDLSNDSSGNMTSNDSSSKSILSSFFNTQDSDFPDSIFSFKNTFAGSFGIWVFVYIIFFIFEYKYINNIGVGFRKKVMKFLTISLVLFAYSLYLSYRNYGKNDDENDVFDKNSNLTGSMFKDSINNIFQAIVKYNYPCMPFGKKN
jgi:hypothetical protein